MKNIIKTRTLFGAGLTALAFSSILSSTAFAQTCAVVPTCSELGYDLSASDCAGKKALKCPFDNTKFYCPDSSGNNGGCTSPNVGSILYSDKSCSTELISGKIPIGVIFNPTKRLAIALETKRTYWSRDYVDIPHLTNYTSTSSIKNDWAGKSNTNIVLNYCKTNSLDCSAFEYVNTYKTDGTKAGDWYLPAAGELNYIYENMAVLNNTLSSIGRTQLVKDSKYWSSSEYNDSFAWYQDFYNGRFIYDPSDYYIKYTNSKSIFYNVLPVLVF